eukprot:6602997-Pyramimonas_sp.AAC.1
MIAGRLWFDVAGMPLTCHAEYVPSKLNLADGPSRNDASLLELCNSEEVLTFEWPEFHGDLG